MSLEFKREKSHSTKWSKKYPRATINNKGGDKKAAIAVGWYKFNWNDDHFNMFKDKCIIRFLKSNVGRPINKVFSEFLSKCDSKLRKNYPLKEEFYSFIKKKEDIDDYSKGFYVTNGILNYKEKKKGLGIPLTFDSWNLFTKCVEYNNTIIPNKKIVLEICEKVLETKTPQLLGKFYTEHYELDNVYITCSDVPDNFLYSKCEIIGVGAGIVQLAPYSIYYGKRPINFRYTFVVKNKKNKV